MREDKIKSIDKMPTFAKNHEENRKKVCAVCFAKTKRSIQPKDIERVTKYVVENYDISNPCFAAGMCNSCHLILSRFDAKDFSRGLRVCLDQTVHMKTSTRSASASQCSCRLCNIARQNIVPKKENQKPGTVYCFPIQCCKLI